MSKDNRIEEEKVIPLAISGFRLFQAPSKQDLNKEFFLKSLYQSSTWERGENKAICTPRNIYYLDLDNDKTNCFVTGNKVPDKDCHCGLQAYYELELDLIIEPSFFDRYTIASVAGAGKALMHRHGFRSEKSQITGLFMPDYSQMINSKDLKEVNYRQIEIARFYKVPIFHNKEEFVKNAQKYGQLINPKKDRHLMPRKGDFIRMHYGLNSLDHEIEIHGGDCSLKILNSITDHNYQFDDYPRSLLVKRSLFRSFALSNSARKRRLKNIDNDFYKQSSGLIKEKTSQKIIKVARFFDSPRQYLLLGMLLLLSSTLLNLNQFSFIPSAMQSLGVLIVLASTILFFRLSRKWIRKRLIKPVNKNLNNKTT